jgi:hypothetical protein
VRRREYKNTLIEASIPSFVHLERQRHYSRKSLDFLEASERIELGCSERDFLAQLPPQNLKTRLCMSGDIFAVRYHHKAVEPPFN